MGKRNTSRTLNLEEVVTVLEHAGVFSWRLSGGRLRAKVIFELDELECEDGDVRWAPVLRAYCYDPLENRTHVVESQASREYFHAHVVWVESRYSGVRCASPLQWHDMKNAKAMLDRCVARGRARAREIAYRVRPSL